MPRITSLPEGKIPIDILSHVLESVPKGELLVPTTRVGMDAAIVKSEGNYFSIVSGVKRGKYKNQAYRLVIELANLLTQAGSRPRIVCPVILFPKWVSSRDIKNVVSEISRGAAEVGVTVAKGHTEIVGWLDKRTIIVTIIGSSRRRPKIIEKKRMQ